MRVTPITTAEANAFVLRHHRHHRSLKVGFVFCVAVADEANAVRGVAIVGRPVSQYLWDGYTLEVRRLATDGAKNACSMLYGAAWRAARALGYRQLITYTLASEPGTSLRASGWRVVAKVSGQAWDAPERDRPRVDLAPAQTKLRWAAGRNSDSLEPEGKALRGEGASLVDGRPTSGSKNEEAVSCGKCGAVTLPGEPPMHNRTCLHRPRRPNERCERRALRWLMDMRENGGPLERRYAASLIETLAYFEQEVPVDTRP